jgi:malonyl CoA-acyl carrier protein transacylase
MIANGLTEVVEVGPGTVLQGLFKKAGSELQLSSANIDN